MINGWIYQDSTWVFTSELGYSCIIHEDQKGFQVVVFCGEDFREGQFDNLEDAKEFFLSNYMHNKDHKYFGNEFYLISEEESDTKIN
jgi:hypothetical protein